MARNKYSATTKLRAIEALKARPAADVAKAFGLSDCALLYNWRSQKDRLLEQRAMQKRTRKHYYSQVTLLRRAIKRMLVESEIIQRALLYFGKTGRRRTARTVLNPSFRHDPKWLRKAGKSVSAPGRVGRTLGNKKTKRDRPHLLRAKVGRRKAKGLFKVERRKAKGESRK